MEKDKKHNVYYLMSQIEKLRKEGVPEKDVAAQFGFESTVAMRKFRSAFRAGSWVVYQRWARYLEKEGKSKQQIALIIGLTESSIRLMLEKEEDIQATLLAEEA